MATPPDPDDELVTPSQLAAEWDTTEAALGQQRYKRTGPNYVKVGTRVFYRRSAIRAYLDARTVTTR